MVSLIRKRFRPVLIAGALVLGVWGVAHAHATLLSAEPAAASHLDASPPRIRLVFSEQLEIGLAKISLTGDDGQVQKLKTEADPHDVRAVIAPLSALKPGSYKVQWHVVSDDGHPVDGSYVFSVGAAQAVAPPPTVVEKEITVPDEPTGLGPMLLGAPILPALVRGFAVGTLMALAGLLFFAWLPRTTADAEPLVATSLARWLSVVVVVLLPATLGTWAANASVNHQLTGEALSAALSTTAGRIELWRCGLALLALWALTVARRSSLALLFVTVAVALSGANGHAAALQPMWNIPLKAIHLLASSAWIGGLLWLVTRQKENAAGFSRDAFRVSGVALYAVLLVAISGVVQTLINLPELMDVFRSAYGAVVLAKTAGLLALVAFGAWHRYRLMPKLNDDSAMPARLASSVRRELVVISAVVLLGGFLAYVPTPEPPMNHSHSMPDHKS